MCIRDSVYSSAVGPISTIKDINEGIFERGIGKMNPFSFPNSVDNAAPGYITMTSRKMCIRDRFTCWS